MLIKDRKLILANWMLMLYVFSIVVFDEGNPVLKIVRVVFLAFCLLKILVEKRVYFNSFLLWAAAFTALCFLSVFWAVSRENALDRSLTVLYNSVCAFCVINFISNDLNRIHFILKTIFFSAIVLWARVAIQYGLFAFLNDRGGVDMISANTVGMISAIALALCFYLLKNGLCCYRLPYYFGLALNMAAVVLSASRKALFYASIPILVYFVLKSGSTLKLVRNVLIGLSAMVLAYIIIIKIDPLYQIIGNRMETMINGFLRIGQTDSSTSLRLDMIKWGLKWFSSNIWLGYGIDNYSILLGTMGTSYGSSGVYAHNNYVELLVNLGLTGTFIYYSLYLDVLVSGLKRLVKMAPEQLIMFGLFISLVFNEFGTVSYYSKFLQLIILLIWMVIKKYPVLKEECCGK